MSISLLCTQVHPALPALAAGIALTLTRTPDGQLHVSMPGNSHFLAQVRAALVDGALAPDADPDQIAELEAILTADRTRLLAQADQVQGEPSRPRLVG